MQCKDFREISDSYLSDELLVETNHQIFRHMEHCPECRADFAGRRKFRSRLRNATLASDTFQMSPVFLSRLAANLEAEASSKRSWRSLFAGSSWLVPAMASFAIGFFLLGVAYFGYTRADQVATSKRSVVQGLTEISLKAVGDHKDCALENLPRWQEVAATEYPDKAVFTEKVLVPLKAKFSAEVEMLNAHDCIYEGKLFTHIVLKDGERILSVFVDSSGEIQAGDSTHEAITSDSFQGLQVASFHNSKQVVFVVSDLPEIENVKIARTISSSFSV
jgi:hypothetical protein